MKRSLTALAVLSVLALPAGGQRQQQTENAFNWNGRVPAGRWIHVVNLNGGITVGQASGDNVEVTAVKRWRRGDPAVVRFEARKLGSTDEGMLICALWGDRADCNEDGYQSRGRNRDRGPDDDRLRNNDVSVEFRVLVPRGVKVGVHTINGDVLVDGATSDVAAGTINGEVEVTSGGGRVNATNVNGNVRARLGRLDPDGRMDFTTVNGNVVVEFPGDVGADLDMHTVNGSLNTNFEMTLVGRVDPKRIRTHIGRPGGPRLRASTVNGNVELRRR
jgi:hypothetical protein